MEKLKPTLKLIQLNKNTKEMSLQRVFKKLIYWDVYLSRFLNDNESLILTVMLYLPSLIFSPKTLIAPIFFIAYQYGYTYSIRYVISIVLSLILTTFFKNHFKRPRPKPRPQLSIAFGYKEGNYSLPSGGCAQAATFLFYFLNANGSGIFCYVSILVDIFDILIAIHIIFNVMLGRVYFCCHYFSDCHLGFVIGTTSAFLINFLLQ
ncbi:unnamed protein product (macronuclear) [Paramecium tetraurelia]|uniref:Phosphatidic acid phosphatase type 2/haloperoxidase domain-containing protein n=1 Tax=Paramecium tetraurelia TaxID=5888 RepID=A0ECG7_PARTE|nr:uncharacterized protein GSPATT00003853001 [Paramecium tetraurelia]CAK92984.1 unnamed protein product [Paramecium tetraurelia]|eukprot:XP_001460381.1 hypothetical protein (macronuclear) [Paramecium tetraurelia strain d4-2]